MSFKEKHVKFGGRKIGSLNIELSGVDKLKKVVDKATMKVIFGELQDPAKAKIFQSLVLGFIEESTKTSNPNPHET